MLIVTGGGLGRCDWSDENGQLLGSHAIPIRQVVKREFPALSHKWRCMKM